MPIARIQPPNLDDRTWEQIVAEMKNRIPTVAPEWTDHNPSDPGIALIELFSHIAEMIIYRLNQVPEKNYIQFLNLLDITRDPPTPAKVALTFELSADIVEVPVPRGTQVSTVPTEQEEAIVFEIDADKTLTKDDNKIGATNALTIQEAEALGLGTGEAYQVYRLNNAPLYYDPVYRDPETNKPDPYYHLIVQVAGKTWKRQDEFSENQPESYRCNPVTGEIIFGDGNFGGIPAQGAEIKAMSYRYVIGGVRSNVPANSLTLLKSPIPGVKSVTNEERAEGGTEWEAIEDTKRRAPLQIKSRYRAVTREDYEFLAKEATNEVAKVRCLGPKKKEETEDGWVYETDPLDRNPGNVNLIIVPDDVSRMPAPSEELMNEVKTFLDRRRVLTCELFLNPPFYVEIGVEQTTVYIRPGEDKENVKKNIIDDLVKFFHPVSGGNDGKGWEIGEDVYLPQVFERISRHPEVSYIEKLNVKRIDGTPSSGVRVEIKEYEIVCAADPTVSGNFNITIEEEQLDLS